MKSYEIMDALTDMEDDWILQAELSDRKAARKPKNLRWIGRVAVIAAVVAALGITAFAAGVAIDGENPIAAYVSRIFGKDLTDKQAEVATEIGKTYDKPMYSFNGTTITPITAVADDVMLYLYVHVEAPEGTVLPDCAEGEHYEIHGNDGSYSNVPDIVIAWQEWDTPINGVTVRPMPDEDPEDNKKDFVIRLINDGDIDFNDGLPKYLRFGSLWFHASEHEIVPIHKDTTGRCSRICEGNFVIDVNCGYEDAVLEVDTGEVTYYDEEYDFTTVIKKVTITPLHIEVECTRTTCDAKYIFPRGGPVQLVMKDGTMLQALDAYFDAAAQTELHPDSIVGIESFGWFDELIVLEDIDYLVVGDGEIFDVN